MGGRENIKEAQKNRGCAKSRTKKTRFIQTPGKRRTERQWKKALADLL